MYNLKWLTTASTRISPFVMPLSVADVYSSFQAHTLCFYLLGSSLIVLIASGMNCSAVGSCTQENGWAVACSTISTALTLFFSMVTLFGEGEYRVAMGCAHAACCDPLVISNPWR